MLSEKSQSTQNGTMFVDLDWPLNASSPLSASAELVVVVVVDDGDAAAAADDDVILLVVLAHVQ